MADKKFKLFPTPAKRLTPLEEYRKLFDPVIDPDEEDDQDPGDDYGPLDENNPIFAPLFPGYEQPLFRPGEGPAFVNPDGPVFNPDDHPDPPDWGDWEWIRPYTTKPEWFQDRWGWFGRNQGPATVPIDPTIPGEEGEPFPNRPGYGERPPAKDFWPGHWSFPLN